jgi:hypothetical protein
MTATIAPVSDITPQAALSPFARYTARSLAASAFSFGVDAEGIRDVFAGCEERGFGLPPEVEAVVLSELAAMANGAA